MKQFMVMRLLYITIFGTFLSFSSLAQSNFEVSFEQQIEGDHLLVDIYVQKTSGDDFVLGGCNFPFNINSSGLDLSTMSIVDSMTGKFSSKLNPTSYNGPSLNASNSFTHIYFSRNYAGSGSGVVLTEAKERIVRLAVPITDPCTTSQIEWVNRGTLTNFDNKKIKKYASLINSEVFSFTQELESPVITLDENYLQTTSEGQLQWYLDGKAIEEEITDKLELTKEGSYTVTVSNECYSKSSDPYQYTITGPDLEVSAAPNPFVNQTVVSYNLPNDANVSVEVFDMIGNKISTLVSSYQTKGIYSIPFNARQNGSTSGVYFVKLRVGEEVRTQRIVELNSN